jgi:rubrerythrin
MATLSAATVLQWAMEIELNGEAFYKAIAAKAQDTDTKLLFEDLAYQEQRHHRTFQRMLERAGSASAGGSEADVEDYRAFLENALGNALFSGRERGLELARQAETESDGIKAAIAFEKDTLIFFYDLLDMVAPADAKAIQAVIDEEKDHVRQLGRALAAGPWAM